MLGSGPWLLLLYELWRQVRIMYGSVKNGNPAMDNMFMSVVIGQHLPVRDPFGYRVTGDVTTVTEKNGSVAIGEEGDQMAVLI